MRKVKRVRTQGATSANRRTLPTAGSAEAGGPAYLDFEQPQPTPQDSALAARAAR